ncbi:hypothetical protein [Zavarzinella formosa]|uniref:hypothetical protein n=1 Tax=Zavarzinella formosa TaxID=360055 RepID=UPI0002F41FA4|nr:hypothetical protein [Zavarzinella formosa]
MNPLFCLILAAIPSGAPPETPMTPDPKLAALVRQLGDKSFTVREAAARELTKLGSAAIPALTLGEKDTDPEVAERSRQLLPLAAATGRNEKLAQLVKEPAGSPLPKGLAGLEDFLAITGDSKATRQLYTEMLTAHHRIIEALETDPKTAGRLMSEFCAAACDRAQAGARPCDLSDEALLTDRGQVAMFLFVRGHKAFANANEDIGQISNVAGATKLQTFVSGKTEIPGMKNLFLHWLRNERRAAIKLAGFRIATAAKVKEARPIELKVAFDRNLPSHTRGLALVHAGNLGADKQALKAVAPLLEDKTDLGSINIGNTDPMSVQFRDIALGVSIRLADEKLSDFGFNTDRFGDSVPYSHFYYAFPSDNARDKAHAKWKEQVSKETAPAKK